MKALLAILLIVAVSADEFNNYSLKDGPMDYLRGFMLTIGETKKIDQFLECMKDFSRICFLVQDGINLLLTFDIRKMILGATNVVQGAKDYIVIINKCQKGYPILEKLFHDIIMTSRYVFLNRFYDNYNAVMKLFRSGVACFRNGDYACSGVDTGKILTLLYIQYK